MAENKQQVITEILLDEAGVDNISNIIHEWMIKKKVEKKNAVRSRLVMENLLEKLCAHFDRKLVTSIEMKKRFGISSFRILYNGESFNPIDESEMDDWSSHLLSNVGLMPTWSYKNGVNELLLRLPRNKLSGEIWLMLAFVGALILGFMKPAISGLAETIIGDYVFNSISDVFLNLLGTFAGFMIFLTVVAGICGIGNASDFSRMGKYLIGRNLANTFLGSTMCGILMLPLFTFKHGAAGGTSQASSIIEIILQIIPSDPITPFATGNTLQIVFMAIMVGMVIMGLGSKSDRLKAVITEANSVMLRVIEVACGILPLYILASLTLMFWEHGMGIFLSIWKPLLVCVVFPMLLMVIKLVIVSVRCQVSPIKLFKKTFRGFLIGLTTASSTAALGICLEENEKDLGIDSKLSNFGYPIEMIISVSTMGAAFIGILYYFAEYEAVEVSMGWFIGAWIIVPIITAAMPPVSGGVLVCLGILLSQFNISESCLALAGTLSIIGDFFMTAARIVICQMELVLEAKHWGILDYDKLRA